MRVVPIPGRSGAAVRPSPKTTLLPVVTAGGGVTRTSRLRPSNADAWTAFRHMPAWLAQLRSIGAKRTIIDMHDVERMDFMSFGKLLRALRGTGVQVLISNARPHLAVSLRTLDLVMGTDLVDRAPPTVRRPATTASPGHPNGRRAAAATSSASPSPGRPPGSNHVGPRLHRSARSSRTAPAPAGRSRAA
jgi:hypothetical protein